MAMRRVEVEGPLFRIMEDIQEVLCFHLPILESAVDDMDNWMENMDEKQLRALHKLLCE